MVKVGETVRVMAVVLVQTVLIYSSDIWVITKFMVKVLEGFHYCIARRIAENQERHVGLEGW